MRKTLLALAIVAIALSVTSCSFLNSLFGGVPGAPTGVTVTPAISTVTVSWNAVAGATSYTVYDTVDGTTPSASNYADENSPTGTETSITYAPSTLGSLRIVVTASNDNGEGNGSTAVTTTTLEPTGVSSTTPVYNSTVVTTTGTGAYQMTISWNAVSGATGYYLYHTYGSSPGQPSEANVSSSGPTYESSELTTTSKLVTMGHTDTAGYIFYFAVAAVDANGNTGALSSSVEVTVP